MTVSKNKYGQLFRVVAYVPQETFEKIEVGRGLVKQSTYVRSLIEKSL